MSMQSSASEPGYDELFSYRYAEGTDFELTEDGVRQTLEQFDELGLSYQIATIAVVGEQNYRSLTPYLKDIYNRRPEQAPNVSVAYLYSNQLILDVFRTTVARALVRCGDPDGERFAIEQALNSPNMSVVASPYAIRTLNYLVLHAGTDVSAELEFLIEIDSEREILMVAYNAARELVEIQRYLQLKSDAQEAIYTAAIERQRQEGDSRIRRALEMLDDSTRPSWKESLKLLEAQR